METEHGEGRLWTLEGCAYSMEQLYACTLHGVTIASCTVELVGVLGACGCVTSVRSYSDPPIQLGERAVRSSRVLLAFTLRGLPELAARDFLYISRIECRPNAIGVGAKGFISGAVQPVHAHSDGRNSESLVCVQQPATAPTDNFALLHCTFQQGSAVSPVVDVSAPSYAFNLQHRPNSTLLHYYTTSSSTAWQVVPHRLALTFSSATKVATLQHSPLRRAAPHVQAAELVTTPRPDAATFNNSTVLPSDASAPAPNIVTRANLRSSTATTTTTPPTIQQDRLTTQ